MGRLLIYIYIYISTNLTLAMCMCVYTFQHTHTFRHTNVHSTLYDATLYIYYRTRINVLPKQVCISIYIYIHTYIIPSVSSGAYKKRINTYRKILGNHYRVHTMIFTKEDFFIIHITFTNRPTKHAPIRRQRTISPVRS